MQAKACICTRCPVPTACITQINSIYHVLCMQNACIVSHVSVLHMHALCFSTTCMDHVTMLDVLCDQVLSCQNACIM